MLPFDRFHGLAPLMLAAALLQISSISGSCQSGVIPVFNVKTAPYFATGDGTTDDGAAIQKALNDAHSQGGVVYFPAGTYLIGRDVSAPDLYKTRIQGSGVNSTTVLIGRGGSLTISAPGPSPYHAGRLEDFSLRCSDGEAGGQTGIMTQDVIGTKWRDVAISQCGMGIDMQNIHKWTERNDFDDVTFYNCAVAVHFDKLPAAKSPSFGYNSFRIWVNTDKPGSRVFLTSGGGNPYNSYFSVMGNIQPGTIVFDAHSDGFANAMNNNTYFVQLEDQHVASTDPSYMFDNHVESGPKGGITGVSQLSIDKKTKLSAPGSVSLPITPLASTPIDVGQIVTTNNAFDSIRNAQITPRSQCLVQATNAAAGSMTGVYVSDMGWENVRVYHPPIANATFEVWCHQ